MNKFTSSPSGGVNSQILSPARGLKRFLGQRHMLCGVTIYPAPTLMGPTHAPHPAPRVCTLDRVNGDYDFGQDVPYPRVMFDRFCPRTTTTSFAGLPLLFFYPSLSFFRRCTPSIRYAARLTGPTGSKSTSTITWLNWAGVRVGPMGFMSVFFFFL